MSAIPTSFLPLSKLLVFSPLGLSFLDDFSGGSPVGFINPTLEIETSPGSGSWQDTGVRGLFTPGNILAYPNLGRRGRVPTPPGAPKNYRVTIDAQYYNPLYPGGSGSAGVIFTVIPYDNNTDFSSLKPTMITLPLLPQMNYPFDGTTAFLNGRVQGTSGTPVAALLTAVEPFDDTGDTRQTRVLTSLGGVFRLPLRWGTAHSPTTITALDQVSSKSSTLNLTYPYDLSKAQTITIPNP